MATFADAAFLLAVIVFVFVLFPAVMADLRWRRSRNVLVSLRANARARSVLSWQEPAER